MAEYSPSSLSESIDIVEDSKTAKPDQNLTEPSSFKSFKF